MGHRLRQVALTILIGIAPILLLEGALRLAGWPTDRVRSFSKLLNFDEDAWDHSIGMFRPGAHSTVLWPPELSYEVHINSLGLRGPEIERKPPPGVTRILAMGDSMTFGYYVEEDETWPAQLQKSLRDEGMNVEVVNAGSGGWSIDSVTQYWIERAHELDPDYVVVTFYANDIMDLSKPRSVYQSQKKGVGGEMIKRWIRSTAIYELYLRAQVHVKEWRVEREGGRDAYYNEDPPKKRADELWARYAEWLDRFRAELAKRDIPMALAYVPDCYKLKMGLPATDEQRLRALAQERGIPFASPLAAFEKEPIEKLFHVPLDKHISARGQYLLAQAIEKVVKPALPH